MARVDELFGEGAGRARPRLRLLWALLASGLLLALLGMACSAVPGGLVVLLAWSVVERELDRVDSGYLPEVDRPRLRRARRAALAGVGIVLALFALQVVLLCGGAYEALWRAALDALASQVAPPAPT